MRRLLLLALIGLGGFASAQDGWIQVKVSTPDPATLRRLEDSDLNVMDCIPHLGTADVAIGPGELSKLFAQRFDFSVVGPMEDPTDWISRHETGIQGDYRTQYFTADQILAYYEGLRSQYPKLVTRRQIGTSINGEAIWAYRIGLPDPKNAFNNIIVLGLIHAREWISGSVVMHIATKSAQTALAVSKISPSPSADNNLKHQAVWVVPIHNPDGYRYTWTNNRLWRKNRRNNGSGSYGVDLNRNYSKGWGLNGGSSSNKNSETYRGVSAFSEPETQAVRDLVASLPRVGGMIDYHSYSQLVLWPWGYTTAVPPDATLYNTIGLDMKASMSSFGATYTQGETSVILYIASGTSNDFVYDDRHTPCMAVELRDTGQFGFELPESQIYSTQDEAWAGFKRFLSYIPK